MGCNNSKKNSDNSKTTLKIKEKTNEFDKSKPLEAKVCLLGDVAVGKTSIASRYCKNQFNDLHVNTIGGAYLQQKVILNNNVVVKLHIWDTTGDERFRSMTNLYYRDAQAALLTYDISNSSSFNGIEFWINELKEKVESENMILCLVGNKCDVSDKDRQITTQKGKSFAQENDMIFFEISAKTGEGIKELFTELANRLYNEALKKN